MPFTFETKDVQLLFSMLIAKVKDAGGNWVESRLQLDEYIGNNDAQFDLTSKKWFKTSRQWSPRLDGSILSAELQGGNPYGWYGHRTSLDLSLFVQNIKGELVFKRPHRSILLSAACFELDTATLKLQSLCLGTDGKFHLAEIHLNDHYANDNGSFASSSSNNLASLGRNFRIKLSKTSLTLLAELPTNGGEFRSAEIELSINIVNINGKLVFEEHSKALDRDGWLAGFLEPLPILGLVVALVHKLAGNEEQAARALALSTNSSIGLLLGAAIGTLFANPVLGAVVGAAITSPTGIYVEAEISSHLIDDPRLRAQFEEATTRRYIYETLRNMITAGPATNFMLRVSKKLKPQIDRLMDGIKAEVAKTGAEWAVGDRVQNILNGVVDLLTDGVNTEWVKALNEGHKEISRVRSKREVEVKKLEDVEAENRHLKKEKGDLELAKEALEQKHRSLENQLTAARTQNTTDSSTISDLQSQLTSAKSQISTAENHKCDHSSCIRNAEGWRSLYYECFGDADKAKIAKAEYQRRAYLVTDLFKTSIRNMADQQVNKQYVIGILDALGGIAAEF